MPGAAAKDKKQKKLDDFAHSGGAGGGRIGGKESGAGMAEMAKPPEQREAQPELALLLSEVREFRKDISQQLGALNTRLDLAQARADAIATRVQETEQRISVLEDSSAPLHKIISAQQTEIKQLIARQEDAEGRSRRSNVRIIGLPEQESPSDMCAFMEDLIPKLLPRVSLSKIFVVERAHRALGKRPAPGMPPRSIILKVLNYRDRDAILRAAREMGDVQWNGARISFYPDLTPAVQKARKRFEAAKLELRKRKIAYSMMHPARLRVAQNNRTFFFETPEELWAHLEQLPTE